MLSYLSSADTSLGVAHSILAPSPYMLPRKAHGSDACHSWTETQ